jgi:hypothetical protein
MKLDKGCPGERLKTGQDVQKGPLDGCALPSGDVTLTVSRQGPRQAACGPEG